VKQLEFTATIGESKAQVKLTEPQGASADIAILGDLIDESKGCNYL
jgi:hypothetical protein